MGADANMVHLVGRVSAVLEARELPSGDTVVPLRVVVPRPPISGPSASSRATVDVIDVACWSAATRRVARRLEPGDPVEVDGALHRRFFRSGGGVQSRYEVAALRLSRRETPASVAPREPAKRVRTPARDSDVASPRASGATGG